MKVSVFWGITPYIPLTVNRRFGGIYRLHLHGRRMNETRNQLEAGGKLNMKLTFSSETSFDLQWTTWRYIPEDNSLTNSKLNALYAIIDISTDIIRINN
jgi:hypothetical protein